MDATCESDFWLPSQRRQRENLFAVLQKARWKIKGTHGAAELLGVKPTTLISRIERMGLKRPA
jgi:transcriptional regulator with GAF, ATPase, and Fis domain